MGVGSVLIGTAQVQALHNYGRYEAIEPLVVAQV